LDLSPLILKKRSATLWVAKEYFPLLLVVFLFSFKSSNKHSLISSSYIEASSKKISNEKIPGILFRDDSSSCVIPFNKIGNLIIIKASVDSIEGNFILDTGSPHLVLNVVYFRNYPVTVSNDHQTSVSGVESQVNSTQVRQFSFGTLNYYWEKADLIDMGHIENSKGIKILGLLGLSLIQQCEIIIDYNKNLIYIHRIARKEAKTYTSEQLKDESSYSTIPLEILDQKLVAKTEMGGKKLQFILDSGSETNILDSRLSKKIFEHVDITGRLNIRGTGNTIVEALQGNLTGMTIGTHDMGSLPVLITNLEKTCFSVQSCINGVLGLEFLPLQKIGFNFVTRKMYLWK
jgi:hypothetical protein